MHFCGISALYLLPELMGGATLLPVAILLWRAFELDTPRHTFALEHLSIRASSYVEGEESQHLIHTSPKTFRTFKPSERKSKSAEHPLFIGSCRSPCETFELKRSGFEVRSTFKATSAARPNLAAAQTTSVWTRTLHSAPSRGITLFVSKPIG